MSLANYDYWEPTDLHLNSEARDTVQMPVSNDLPPFSPALSLNEDKYAGFAVSDLQLSRLGLSPRMGSSTASSSAGGSPVLSFRSMPSPSLTESSIWAPFASTSSAGSTAALDQSTTRKPGEPLICDWQGCGKVFTRASGLRIHMRMHTGERPYACEVEGCTRAFAQASALKVHQRTHTGARPYACSFEGCDKAFSDSSTLLKHRKTHEAVKRWLCTNFGCAEAFRRKYHRDRHVASCKKETGLLGRVVDSTLSLGSVASFLESLEVPPDFYSRRLSL